MWEKKALSSVVVLIVVATIIAEEKKEKKKATSIVTYHFLMNIWTVVAMFLKRIEEEESKGIKTRCKKTKKTWK